MKRSFLSLITLCALFLTFSACSTSREVQQEEAVPEPPAPEYYVAQNLSARGGADELKSIQALKMTGELEMMGMTMPLTIYQKRPAKSRTEVEVPNMGMTVVSGLDGNTAWMKNPMMTPELQKVPEEQAEMMKEGADIDGVLVDYKENGYTVEYLGEAEVRGNPAYKLRVNRPERMEVIVYLDQDTFLEVKTEGKRINPQSGQIVDSAAYSSDYREVDGIQMPYHIEIEMGGQTQDIKLESIEVNPEVSDDMFAMPQN